MKLGALSIFGLFAFSLNSFGQTEAFFPGKTLYWTNLEKPTFLDNLKSLRLLTYKKKGIVYNKTFHRELKEGDSLREFKTALDFYEYKIRWTRKGKLQFSRREQGEFYFYYGHVAGIYRDKYF